MKETQKALCVLVLGLLIIIPPLIYLDIVAEKKQKQEISAPTGFRMTDKICDCQCSLKLKK